MYGSKHKYIFMHKTLQAKDVMIRDSTSPGPDLTIKGPQTGPI